MTAALQQLIIDKVADEIVLDMRWNDFAKSTLQQERRFKPVLRDLLEKQKQRVLLNIQRKPPPEPEETRVYINIRGVGFAIDRAEIGKEPTATQLVMPWLLDPQEWQIVFENAAKPFVRQTMAEGYDDGLADIENALDVNLGLYFDVSDPNVAQAMQDKLFKFSFEVNDTTNKQLKKSLVEALENGENMRMINQRVSDVFKFAKGYRTERIARTEIIGSYNAGGYQSMLDSDVVKTKRWVATRDSRTRDSHEAMDGEIRPLRQRYSNGLLFPGDWTGDASEVINCRCTEIAEDFKGE